MVNEKASSMTDLSARQNARMGTKMKNSEETVTLTFDNGTAIRLPAGEGNWDKTSQMQHIRAYLKHGIDVKKGDVVFDIGANMGLFSGMIFDRCEGDVNVYAFEVIEETYQVLERVFAQLGSSRMKAYHLGISNRAGSNEFMFYPNAPGLSTQYYSELSDSMEDMIRNMDGQVTELPDFFGDGMEEAEGEKDQRFLRLRAIYSLKSIFQGRKVREGVIPLSDFIAENQISNIDLLKIDVNGSELDVCGGISQKDWKKIRQVVIEVPVRGHRIEQIKDLLRENGFSRIVVERQEAVINQGLVYALVYASKDQTA